MKVVLSLDQGTTSSRAIVFDRAGRMLGLAQKEFRQHYPQPGWVEHDAEEIWETQLATARGALRAAGAKAGEVAAIGITNQRETTILWDRVTGKPVHRALVWQDRRTADACAALRRRGVEERVRRATGLLLDPYFSALKVAWLLDHVPGARAKARAGRLAFGTVDTWLAWKLTGGRRHITDASNASRTMLFHLAKGKWDDVLLRLFRIPRAVLPEIRPSSEVYGLADARWLGEAVPISGIAGDQQAALFGQAGFTKGVVKNTYGTGCFMLMNVGDRPVCSRNRLLTTVAWRIGDQTTYALEGSVFVAGAAVQWLRDGLGLIRRSADIEALARSVPDSGGVVVVPSFTGLGAPYWDPNARGAVLGLTRGSTAAHLARAVLDAIASQSVDVLDAMKRDARMPIRELRVDGGASRNDLLMQLQADIAAVPVIRPRVTETTALGAAFLAGLAVGFWNGRAEIESLWRADRRFRPRGGIAQRTVNRLRWADAVARVRSEPAMPLR